MVFRSQPIDYREQIAVIVMKVTPPPPALHSKNWSNLRRRPTESWVDEICPLPKRVPLAVLFYVAKRQTSSLRGYSSSRHFYGAAVAAGISAFQPFRGDFLKCSPSAKFMGNTCLVYCFVGVYLGQRIFGEPAATACPRFRNIWPAGRPLCRAYVERIACK